MYAGAAVALATLLVVGCSVDDEPGSRTEAPSPSTPGSSAPPASTAVPSSRAPAVPSPGGASPAPARPTPVDPRWVFFTDDRRRYASPWFPGRHRVMIPFGCTPAPFYDPDPMCPGTQGFHHGIDVAIPCGTPLVAADAGRALDHDALGPAYGVNPMLLRVAGHDIVIGHTRRVFAQPGARFRRGETIARISDSAASDGCHLHFEVRTPGGGVADAVPPGNLLGLH